MKKLTIAAILFLGLGFGFTSCENTKKEEASEQEIHAEHKDGDSAVKEHEHTEDMAMATYQCPMKCEGDKTYNEAGSCPVCKMDLKKVEKEAGDSTAPEKENEH